MKIELLQKDCLSEYQMDQHLLGLESKAEKEAVLNHIAHCELCRKELEVLASHRKAFLQNPEMPPLPKHKDTEIRGSSFSARSKVISLLAACLVGILFFPVMRHFQHPIIQTKDLHAPAFMVAVQRGDQKPRIAHSGEHFRPQDNLRLAYTWKPKKLKEGFLFVIHRDQKNTFSPLYPENPTDKSLRILLHQEKALPGSLELDNARQGYEELWACFSNKALSYQEVLETLPRTKGLTQWESQSKGPCLSLHLFQLQREHP